MYFGDNKHIKHCQRTFGNPYNDIEPEFAGPDSHEEYPLTLESGRWLKPQEGSQPAPHRSHEER